MSGSQKKRDPSLEGGISSEIRAAIREAVAAEVQRVTSNHAVVKAIRDDASLDSSSSDASAKVSCGNYYLDEAGDTTLFAHKGRVIIGEEGCSRFAMLGLLDVRDPEALSRDLEDLRQFLTSDPYFKGVPSFDPARRRTALCFHAKDDPPEVRREVFRLLLRHDLKFSAVVSDKKCVLEEYVRVREREEPGYRYSPNEQYDYMVKCLFKGRVHKKREYNIHFSYRGTSSRTDALYKAVLHAQRETTSSGPEREAPKLNISVHKTAEEAGCQAADYFLWSLQRMYEKEEDRFLEMLQSKISMINDRNCRREGHHGGTYYTRSKPLTLAALREHRKTSSGGI